MNLITEPINQVGNSEMKEIFNDKTPFSNPKPVGLIRYLLKTVKNKESFVLDFFAGSGSFCQATEEVNKEDGKNLQCLLIQLDEAIQEGTEAYSRCQELGIEPTIPSVLEARLKKVGCDYSMIWNSK
jgi:adenine-specific DNA-methyltransferase